MKLHTTCPSMPPAAAAASLLPRGCVYSLFRKAFQCVHGLGDGDAARALHDERFPPAPAGACRLSSSVSLCRADEPRPRAARQTRALAGRGLFLFLLLGAAALGLGALLGAIVADRAWSLAQLSLQCLLFVLFARASAQRGCVRSRLGQSACELDRPRLTDKHAGPALAAGWLPAQVLQLCGSADFAESRARSAPTQRVVHTWTPCWIVATRHSATKPADAV